MSNQEKGQVVIGLEIKNLTEFKKEVEAELKKLEILEKPKVSISQAITKFSIEVLQIEETKNNPEMVAAIAELLKIGNVSNLRI
ncbi:hypothetical protein [Pseudolactococcus raffinolactis]|uniref:hypothetical protein n=1 Tax=Pseudolactococcus raffinolactis TaxID=1366 RepID=UPI00143686EC|nr:hypothetical protein [Lactococcus raffinolactis]QIW51388.1 hypothetical protein GU337_05625 [Lactococcus raffinolactis]